MLPTRDRASFTALLPPPRPPHAPAAFFSRNREAHRRRAPAAGVASILLLLFAGCADSGLGELREEIPLHYVASPAQRPSASPGEPPQTERPPAITKRLPSPETATPAPPAIVPDWPTPKFALFVTGRQNGYIEPCGCTGLENAKGGLSRRVTLLEQLRAKGWGVAAVDVGDQVRRFGKQAEIKFQRTADVLMLAKYDAIGFGPDDLRLSLDGLLAPVNEAGTFVSANVDLLGLNAAYKIVTVNQQRIGITAVLGLEEQKKINRDGSELTLSDPVAALRRVLPEMQAAGCDFLVLLAHASLAETRQIVQQFPQAIDVVVTAGGAGEPTLDPEPIRGTKTQMIQTGTKGMYVGLVGVFDDPRQPLRYARVELDARFADASKVLEIFADYQNQLKVLGLEGLGVRPVKHPTGRQFVGSSSCGDCHTEAYAIFENTPHFHATDSLVRPPNSRGSIPRHFDPECLSCHVIGWNPQEYFPYESGYLQLAQKALHGNGCENCHGPGSAHVAAENGDTDASDEQLAQLRAQMRVTLEHSKKTACYECHDLDNSPEFEFDSYWEEVEHHGKD